MASNAKRSLENYYITIVYILLKYRLKFPWNIRNVKKIMLDFYIYVHICLFDNNIASKNFAVKDQTCIYITSSMVDYCGQYLLDPLYIVGQYTLYLHNDRITSSFLMEFIFTPEFNS